MTIYVAITTYGRPEMLERLVRQILEDKTGHEVEIHIYNDGSDTDYSKVIDLLPATSSFTSTHHHGKQDYWKLVSLIYQESKDRQWDYFIQLPDDVEIYTPFIDECIRLYAQIPDGRKACLTIDLKQGRRKVKQWTAFQPYEVSFGGNPYYRTGWVDLCFIAQRPFMDHLGYRVPPVLPSWFLKMGRSSGVGHHISNHLHKRGSTMYQVGRTMVWQGHHESQMNGYNRRKHPSIKNREHVLISVASIPSRAEALRNVFRSLVDQADTFKVYLNGYTSVPAFLSHPKVRVCQGDDLGDAGKFFENDRYPGYVLTVDDDLNYPADYVAALIGQLERYGRKSVVSYHGRILKDTPIKSYYRGGKRQFFRCLDTVEQDALVHIAGTGVMAYHTDTVNPSIDVFEYPNMADIWMGLYCQEHRIPMVALAHKAGWITHSTLVQPQNTLAITERNRDHRQTEAANRVKWRINYP